MEDFLTTVISPMNVVPSPRIGSALSITLIPGSYVVSKHRQMQIPGPSFFGIWKTLQTSRRVTKRILLREVRRNVCRIRRSKPQFPGALDKSTSVLGRFGQGDGRRMSRGYILMPKFFFVKGKRSEIETRNFKGP